jgi:hypothetical protein
MQIGNIQNNITSSPVSSGIKQEKVSSEAPKQESIYPSEDGFSSSPKKSDISYARIAVKAAAGAAIGAGALILSGGSILAAVGIGGAIGGGLGALKGIGSAFYSSINFGGHSGASSSLDRNIGFATVVHGSLGALKGFAQGAIVGAAAAIGAGPIAGAVTGAITEFAVPKAATALIEKMSSRPQGLHD